MHGLQLVIVVKAFKYVHLKRSSDKRIIFRLLNFSVVWACLPGSYHVCVCICISCSQVSWSLTKHLPRNCTLCLISSYLQNEMKSSPAPSPPGKKNHLHHTAFSPIRTKRAFCSLSFACTFRLEKKVVYTLSGVQPIITHWVKVLGEDFLQYIDTKGLRGFLFFFKCWLIYDNFPCPPSSLPHQSLPLFEIQFYAWRPALLSGTPFLPVPSGFL